MAPGRTGVDILQAFFDVYEIMSPPFSPPDMGLQANLENSSSNTEQRSVMVSLENGNDGIRPTMSEYEGQGSGAEDLPKTGLKQFEDLEDISIVAAPGSTYGFNNGYESQARAITGLLIRHTERMRYRIAILDCGNDQSISEVRAFRAQSKYAALYYPVSCS